MCEFPQEMGFRFDGEVDLRCIRVLSHESKISMKIDVYVARVGDPTSDDSPAGGGYFPDYDKASFGRLGFMSFSTNEETQFNARELKTARIRTKACYVKLLLRKCHANPINVFNQVGLVAVAFHGEMLAPLRPHPQSSRLALGAHGAASTATWDHLPGSARVANRIELLDDEVPLDDLTPQLSAKQDPTAPTNQKEDDVDMDEVTTKRIRDLSLYKARAVAEEDYDLAKVLKEQIEQLKSVGSKIAMLEQQKKVAVDQEDYDVAKALKRQIDELRNPERSALSDAAGEAGRMRGKSNTQTAASTQRPDDRAQPADEPVVRHPAGPNDGSAAIDPIAESDEQVPSTAAPPRRNAASHRPLPVNHDDLPAVSKAAGVASFDELVKNSETGGIVGIQRQTNVNPAANGKLAVVSAPSMPAWERSINELVMKLAGEEQAPADSLAAPKLAEYQQFSTVFGLYVTTCLFSKRWQLRDAAIRAITSKEGFAALTSGVRPPGQGSPQTIFSVLLQYLNGKTSGITDSISNVFYSSSEALRVVAREELEGCPPASALSSGFAPILPDLIAKAGDSNQRIREHASTTLMIIALSSVGCEKVAHAAFLEPEGAASAAAAGTGATSTGPSQGSGASGNVAAKAKPLNPRVHLARLTTVQALVEKLGLNRRDNRTGLTAEGIMQRLCVPLLVHSNVEVREAAVHLVITLHGLVSSAVMEKLLAEVKPAQRAVIDEQLAGGRAPPDAVHAQTGGRNRAEGMEMASSSITVERGGNVALAAAQAASKAPPAKAKAPSVASGNPNSSGTAPPAVPQPPGNKTDPTKTCQFCGRFDKRFNDRSLDLHYAHCCPMLGPCYLCGQIAELSLMHEHLIRDCERAHMVRQCPLCREAVRKEEFDVHVSAKSCIAANPPAYSVCPLCHLKLAPGDQGWEDHFLKAPGCRNNPRKFDADPIPPNA